MCILRTKLCRWIFFLFLLVSTFLIWKFLYWFSSSQSEAEIIRKMSSIRLCLTLYSINENKISLDPQKDLKKVGYLNEIPQIKLKWKFPSREIRLVDRLEIKNTGKWAYIKNAKDTNFGLFYIDSSAKDSKGRYWSWL